MKRTLKEFLYKKKKKEFLDYKKECVPKHIIENFLVGFGVNAREVFICKEITNNNETVIFTAYTTVNELDRYYNYIIDDFDEEGYLENLFNMGIDYVNTSLYNTVPGSEKFCLKDKKVIGVAYIRSFLTDYLFEDMPNGLNIKNWVNRTDFTDSYELVKNIAINVAEYLNKEKVNENNN